MVNEKSVYEFTFIEKKWQEFWEKSQTYHTGDDQSKPKYYVLDMFPYPSGAGLHVGHPEGYTATDIIARYKRMKGFNVLHPMGWDAFGLPAERYAMQTGIHPSVTTEKNISNFKRQLKSLGFSYDWQREINTTDQNYYKWTQWIFLKIFNSWYDYSEKKAKDISSLPLPAELNQAGKEKEKRDYINSKRLAYISEMPVNWCEALGTVLANEEVEEWTGKGYTVERRPMRQWMLRITAYAERLLDDLKYVDWPQGTLELQKNWIGRSEGAEIEFEVEFQKEKLTVYTTRPDTLFGVTYMVLAPEHSLVEKISTPDKKNAIDEYIKETSLKSELDRQLESEKGKKSGLFTGAYAIHPVTSEKIPIWIADYVFMGYGHGAIMAVPAHDQRDYDFAKVFNLPIRYVVKGNEQDEGKAFSGEGINIQSDFLNGLKTSDAKEKMITYLVDKKIGRKKVQYRLRDWLFSRQRYWGEPIPVSLDDEGNYYAENELPLVLPPSEEFKPAGTGESPLANLKEWINHSRNGIVLRRESNTMPQWAGSSWYYLRFIDPDNSTSIITPEKERYWMGETGVDLYVGGSEHAVLHLLYSRFWHKLLFDYGYVSQPEPFKKLIHQGLILGEDGSKMSKSRGNVVNPDEVVAEYGADAFRMFEMFMGPLEQMKPWSSKSIEGVSRFLQRVWRFFMKDEKFNREILEEPSDRDDKDHQIHKTIKKVTKDIENLSFNTAISQMMIYLNFLYQTDGKIGVFAAQSFIKILSPFAPHIAEELWSHLYPGNSIFLQNWPEYNENLTIEKEIEVVVQINGKLRAKKNVVSDINEEDLKSLALSDESVMKYIDGKPVKKVIVVKNRLVNIVV